MLYYNSLITKRKKTFEDVLVFNGTTQSLKSRSTAEGGLDFVQWDIDQAWTFDVNFIDYVPTSGIRPIYATRSINNDGSDVGLQITVFNNVISLQIVTAPGGGRVTITTAANQPLSAGDKYINITYNPLNPTGKFNFRVNNVNLPYSGLEEPSGTMINGNKFIIGEFDNQYRSANRFSSLSFVNYVKSSSERTLDFIERKQSVGTGSWLLAPIEPMYKADGTKQIKTLDTTSINNPLPNPDAFVNEQGYKLNLIGYPTPLVQGVNLI